jgi:CDP-diacylglycerol--glycerol-3-phosphate 3-phosphatidyltransferase
MKNLPNAITISRILVTPVLLLLILSDTLLGQGVALGLFVLAAISDYADGKLARVYGVRSRLGQFLDPFADKVLVLGTFAVLAFLIPHVVPWWGVVLIALRDVVVTAMRSYLEAHGRSLRTLPVAKAKTTVQLIFLIAVLLLLVASKLPGTPGAQARWLLESPIPFALMLGVVAFTLYTGVVYLLRQEQTTPANQDG